MRMKRIEFDPDDFQHHLYPERFDEQLKGAVHLETFTYEKPNCSPKGCYRILVIYAFFPDKKLSDIKWLADFERRWNENTAKLNKFKDMLFSDEWEAMDIPILYPLKQRVHFFEGIQWRTLGINFND